MQREEPDGIVILCDFCRRDWDGQEPMIEGHHGSIICLQCLKLALQHQKSLGLGRIDVAVRLNVGVFQQNVQKPVRVVLVRGVEVVVHSPPRGRARLFRNRIEECFIDGLYGSHVVAAFSRRPVRTKYKAPSAASPREIHCDVSKGPPHRLPCS